MSDNKAFTINWISQEPLKISRTSSNSIDIRFGKSLPREIGYPVKDFYEHYSELREKYWVVIEKKLKDRGMSDGEIKGIIEKFNKAFMDSRKKISQEIDKEIEDTIQPYFEKLCDAFEKAAKAKLLEAVHLHTEGEKKLEVEIEKLAKEILA